MLVKGIYAVVKNQGSVRSAAVNLIEIGILSIAVLILDMRLRDAVPTIFLGVCIAAAIMTAVNYGVFRVL